MIKIFFGTTFFIVAVVFIIFNSTFVAQHKDWANILISIISTLSLYITFLIKHSEKVFLLYRKSIEYIKNSTISWNLSSELTIEEFDKSFFFKENAKILRASSKDKIILPKQLTNSMMEWDEYSLTWNQNLSTLTLNMKTKTNYRESKEKIYVRYQKVISELERLTNNIVQEKYTLSINYDGYNPFYGAYVKKLSKSKDSDTTLSFRENNVYIYSEGNTLSIVSDDYEDIKKVARNYFVLKS